MPTVKQKRAAKIKLEHPEMPMGRVMVEAGYSKTSSISPKKLTERDGWAELMEKYLPDEHLGEKHREFLDSSRVVRIFVKGELTSEVSETDPSAVKALDIAYKIKGRYKEADKYIDQRSINIFISPEKARRIIELNDTVEG